MIFHNFSWKSMIFHIFSMKINDFWWFFDENWLDKFDTPVCKLKFSRQIWFLMNFYENQWFLIVFRWKSMIFLYEFSMILDENQWFLMLFWWKSKIFDAFSERSGFPFEQRTAATQRFSLRDAEHCERAAGNAVLWVQSRSQHAKENSIVVEYTRVCS